MQQIIFKGSNQNITIKDNNVYIIPADIKYDAENDSYIVSTDTYIINPNKRNAFILGPACDIPLNYNITKINGLSGGEEILLTLRHRDSIYTRAFQAAQLRYDALNFIKKFTTSITDLFNTIYNSIKEANKKEPQIKAQDILIHIQLVNIPSNTDMKVNITK